MIIKMKSITVLGLESQTDGILEELRRIGVVHIKHVRAPEGASLEAAADAVARASAACAALPEGPESDRVPFEGKELVDKVFALAEKKRALSDEIAQLEREASRVEFLGDFEPADVEYLKERGIYIRLFQCDKKQLSTLPSDLVYRVLSERDKKAVIAVVLYRKEEDLSFSELPVPPRSAMSVRRIIGEKKKELADIQRQIDELAPYRPEVQRTLVNLENKWEFEKVRYGRGESENVIYLKGFCPVPEVDRLEYAARKNAWGLVVDDPSDEEEPPTLLTNPKWIRIIDPVFQFIKTFPGYREFDISMWFLLFFSVFFAMLIGDGGYGLIYFGVTAFAQVKLGKRVQYKEPFVLMYVLSICTVIWGALTGNWFGVEALSRVSPFKDMIVPSLNAFSQVSQNTVVHICFLIGATQLSIGHLLAAFRYINSLKALEQIGWILVIWSAYFVAGMFLLKNPIPSFFPYLIGGGILLILFTIFADHQKRKHAPIAIWDLFMSSISAFADTMSYIRLFAVGLATLAVAQSFNQMGMDVGFGNVFTGIAAALIIFLGHALNIVLALMAVVVHGVRLNMLEFSGHVGNTWSGYEYSPFTEKTSK